MAKILIVAEHLDGRLNAATAKCVSAAKALNPEAIDIAVLAAASVISTTGTLSNSCKPSRPCSP